MSRIALLTILLPLASSSFAEDAFQKGSIVLLQPGFLLEKRVSVEDLSTYIKRLNESAERQATSMSDHAPRTGSIVFAVRPDGSRKIWLDFKPALAKADAEAMVAALEAAEPCAVREGTVVSALNVSLWGGKGHDMGMPMPEEWRSSITSDGVEVTKLVDSLWPQAAAPNSSAEPKPGE